VTAGVCYAVKDLDEYKSAWKWVLKAVTRSFAPTPKSPNCYGNCPDTWIGDGMCDGLCNYAECNWDGGDCDSPSDTTTPAPTTVGVNGTRILIECPSHLSADECQTYRTKRSGNPYGDFKTTLENLKNRNNNRKLSSYDGLRWDEEQMFMNVWSQRTFQFYNFLPSNLYLKVDMPEGWAPGMEFVVTASFAATFTIPEGVTTDDLIADESFTGALSTGIANTLGVSSDDVVITDISESSRRKLVSEKRQLSGVSLVVEYSVTMGSESAADAIATNIADNADELGTTMQAEITEAITADDSLSTSYGVSEVTVNEATVTTVDTLATTTTTTPAPTTTAAAVKTTAAVANTTTVAEGDDDDDDSGDDAAPAAPAEESFAILSTNVSLFTSVLGFIAVIASL
jgi:hypothetical protein